MNRKPHILAFSTISPACIGDDKVQLGGGSDIVLLYYGTKTDWSLLDTRPLMWPVLWDYNAWYAGASSSFLFNDRPVSTVPAPIRVGNPFSKESQLGEAQMNLDEWVVDANICKNGGRQFQDDCGQSCRNCRIAFGLTCSAVIPRAAPCIYRPLFGKWNGPFPTVSWSHAVQRIQKRHNLREPIL